MPITVAIVEDNAEVGQELALLLSRTPGLACAAVCRNAPAALATLPPLRPDVILMDVQLPGRSDVHCVQQLKPLLPETQIVMFTIAEDAQIIEQALTAGAIGYLVKSATPDEIIAAIKSAHRRDAPMAPGITRKLVEHLHRQAPKPQLTARLTAREAEVVGLVARGLGDKQIADQLGISLQTVNSHLKNIYDKLEVHSRTEMTVRYLQQTQSP